MSEKIEALRREFVDALARYWVKWAADSELADPPAADSELVDPPARSLLAALVVEKARVNSPLTCAHEWKKGNPGYQECQKCGRWATDEQVERDTPKPEEPTRSVEEILEAAIKDHDYNYDLDVYGIKEALRLYRAAREEHQRIVEERDTWARNHTIVVESYNKVCAANEELEDERDEWEAAYMQAMKRGDELLRRIERAKAHLPRSFDSAKAYRALEGKE